MGKTPSTQPEVGSPLFVYIKIEDFCQRSTPSDLLLTIEMFNAEKDEQDLENDLADNIKWWKVATIEVVEPQQTSEDNEYTNTSTVMDGWDHWYIQPFNYGPLYITQGDRIDEGMGSANPVWLAVATEDSSSDTFEADIYGNGWSNGPSLTSVQIKNESNSEVVENEKISVIQDCNDFFLTNKGGEGEGGSCIEIIYDDDLRLARDFAPGTVVLRGHTDPNAYNIIPFGVEGSSQLVEELCVIRKNKNEFYDSGMPETLTGNPKYENNDFCVHVRQEQDFCNSTVESFNGLHSCFSFFYRGSF